MWGHAMLYRLILLAALFLPSVVAGPAHAQSATTAGASVVPGLVFDAALFSPVLGREMPYRVYLPPNYFLTDSRRYPAMYMLHGAGGNYTEWSDSFLPQQMDDLIARGLIQPMIVIMADGGGRTYFA